ncbi:MAG: hypothetical protein JO091_12365 [Acidobacteriaceae bacterium]|nr:hypothetical protein [Acidobacteriaceae bacterium]
MEYMQASVAQSWDQGYTAGKRWYVHLLPSLTDFAFLLPFFLLFALLRGGELLLSDGDTGWHIRTGDWIWQHRAVPAIDLFSFSKPQQPWFAWEWGWDTIVSAIHSSAGLAGVVLVNAIFLGLVAALLYRLILRRARNEAAAVAFTLLAVCATMMHWLARPHLVSWIFVLVFSHVIASAEDGERRGLYVLPVLMLFWTNLHAGFPVGILLLVASGVGAAIEAALEDGGRWRAAAANARPYLLSALGCLAASFVNPYGWHLHQHVIGYLRDAKLLDNIQEFQSVNFHHPSSIFFECVLLLGVPAAFWCVGEVLTRKPGAGKMAAGILTLLWAHLALVSGRNAPLFVLIAAPWAALMSVAFMRRLAWIGWIERVSATISDICAEMRPLERIERWHVVSAGAVAFVAFSMASLRPGFGVQFNPKNFPLQAVPALASIEDLRVFTTDQWADYLIYRFYPSERVFLDGRSDFYGTELVTVYQHIMSAQYDWESDLRRFQINAVMLKPDAPLAAVLKQAPGWRMLFDNGSVLIFRAVAPARQAQAVLERGAGSAAGGKARPRTLVWARALNDLHLTINFDERRSL